MLKPHELSTILSTTELKILECLSYGKLYKEIGNERNITINTVKKHCNNIYKKLKVRNKTEAIIKYLDG